MYAYALANPVNWTDPTGRCVPFLPGCKWEPFGESARQDFADYATGVGEGVVAPVIAVAQLFQPETWEQAGRGVNNLVADPVGSGVYLREQLIDPIGRGWDVLINDPCLALEILNTNPRGVGNILGTTAVTAASFRAALRSPQTLGKLRSVSANEWESSAGLRYGPDPNFGNRVQHVLRHAVDDPLRPEAHGVFSAGRSGTLKVVDEAWMLAQRGGIRVQIVQQGARTRYIVDMGRDIGYVGGQEGTAAGLPTARHVLLVVENGNRVVTAFPIVPEPPVPVLP